VRAVSRLATIVALAGISLAWQQQGDDGRLQRLDPRTRDAVSAVVDRARKDGIPTEPLVDRALEGASKRAAGTVIVSAVSRFADDMRRARTALGPGSTPTEIVAAAYALRNGVKVEELEKLRNVREGQRYASTAAALDAMSYLINRGVPPDTASRALVSLVLAQATDDQITDLRREVEQDIAGGMPAGIAVAARAVGVERALAAANNSGGPDARLPSGRGSIAGGPAGAGSGGVAGPTQGNAAASAGEGSRPPAPRGKPKKRP
jgi:hypothetical protein